MKGAEGVGMESEWRDLCPERRALERKWGKRRKSEGGWTSGLKEGREFIHRVHVVGILELDLMQQFRGR
jgi:hypothetical protein